jgi:hypothetical protein
VEELECQLASSQLSSEHMVNDDVEKEVFACKGHRVRLFPISCHTFS